MSSVPTLTPRRSTRKSTQMHTKKALKYTPRDSLVKAKTKKPLACHSSRPAKPFHNSSNLTTPTHTLFSPRAEGKENTHVAESSDTDSTRSESPVSTREVAIQTHRREVTIVVKEEPKDDQSVAFDGRLAEEESNHGGSSPASSSQSHREVEINDDASTPASSSQSFGVEERNHGASTSASISQHSSEVGSKDGGSTLASITQSFTRGVTDLYKKCSPSSMSSSPSEDKLPNHIEFVGLKSIGSSPQMSGGVVTSPSPSTQSASIISLQLHSQYSKNASTSSYSLDDAPPLAERTAENLADYDDGFPAASSPSSEEGLVDGTGHNAPFAKEKTRDESDLLSAAEGGLSETFRSDDSNSGEEDAFFTPAYTSTNRLSEFRVGGNLTAAVLDGSGSAVCHLAFDDDEIVGIQEEYGNGDGALASNKDADEPIDNSWVMPDLDEKLSSENQALKENAKTLKKQLELVQQERDVFERRFGVLHGRFTSLKASHSDLCISHDASIKLISTERDAANVKEAELLSDNEKLEEFINYLESENLKLAMAETELTLSKNENLTVSAERDRHYSERCSLSKKLIAANHHGELLASKIRITDFELQTLRISYNLLERESEATLTIKERELVAVEQKYNEILSDKEIMHCRLDSLSDDKDHIERKLEDTSSMLSVAQVEVNSQQTIISRLESSIQVISTERDVATEEVTKLLSRNKSSMEKMSALKSKCDAMKDTESILESKRDELSEQVDILTNKNVELEKQCNSIEDSRDALEVHALKEDLKSTKEKLDEEMDKRLVLYRGQMQGVNEKAGVLKYYEELAEGVNASG